MTPRGLLGTVTLVVLVPFLTAIGQGPRSTPPSARPGQTRNGPMGKNHKPHEQPCWEQAGIPKSVIEKRRAIQENMRAQLREICSDSSLTPEQQRDKIHEVRKSSQAEMQAMLTPGQQEKLKACQTARRGERAAGQPSRPGPSGGHGGNPCDRILGH